VAPRSAFNESPPLIGIAQIDGAIGHSEHGRTRVLGLFTVGQPASRIYKIRKLRVGNGRSIDSE
jgi:hypothetical protein